MFGQFEGSMCLAPTFVMLAWGADNTDNVPRVKGEAACLNKERLNQPWSLLACHTTSTGNGQYLPDNHVLFRSTAPFWTNCVCTGHVRFSVDLLSAFRAPFQGMDKKMVHLRNVLNDYTIQHDLPPVGIWLTSVNVVTLQSFVVVNSISKQDGRVGTGVLF